MMTVGRTDISEITALDTMAQADGFRGWRTMVDWFAEAHRTPFKGVLIRWELIT